MAVMYKEQCFSVHTMHCDFQDKIRPSAVLDFFQDMAGTHADELGAGFEAVRSLGYIWVVLYEQFEVVSKTPSFGDSVLVKTWPKPRGRLEFEREYEICSADGTPAIRGISNWALVDIRRRTVARAEDVDFNGEYYDKTSYPQKQKRKLNLQPQGYDAEICHTVVLSDLDHNLHLNNAKYLDIIYNMNTLESYRPWKKVEIAFIREARLNDKITVRHWKEDERDCYQGFVGDTPCFEATVYPED